MSSLGQHNSHCSGHPGVPILTLFRFTQVTILVYCCHLDGPGPMALLHMVRINVHCARPDVFNSGWDETRAVYLANISFRLFALVFVQVARRHCTKIMYCRPRIK